MKFIGVIKSSQNYTSRGTSLNQIPALHKKIKFEKDTINFDNGAGKYDKTTNYLKDLGVNNVRFDPYNLSDEINNKSNDYVGKCDTSTLANVLNVIDDENSQIEALQKSKDMLKHGGKLYISVYEGNRSGVGAKSKNDCWQNNKKLNEYLETVKKVFDKVEKYNNMIVAIK